MTSKSTDEVLGAPPALSCSLSNLLDEISGTDRATPGTLAWEAGPWKVDFWRQQVLSPSGSVRLNAAELIVFGRLLAAAGSAVSRDVLEADLLRLWNSGATENVATRLALYVSRMRAKFARARVPFPIRSVRGKGYQLKSSTAH